MFFVLITGTSSALDLSLNKLRAEEFHVIGIKNVYFFKSLSDAEELYFICLIHHIRDEHYLSVIVFADKLKLQLITNLVLVLSRRMFCSLPQGVSVFYYIYISIMWKPSTSLGRKLHCRLVIHTKPFWEKQWGNSETKLTIHAVSLSDNIPTCMSIENVQETTLKDNNLQDLFTHYWW